MADDGPAAVEPAAAFYGLWPKFDDPVGKGAGGAPVRREQPTRHVCGWWTAPPPGELRVI
jgi:hypothetical protein